MGTNFRANASGVFDAKETTMKNSVKLALGFVALSTALAGTAYADNGKGMRGEMGFGPAGFETLDGDKSGDVTFEEFKKAAGEKFTLADADKDGKVTVAEMAAAIEKIRAEMMAKRMMTRMDIDGDGAVTLAEIEKGQQEIYALLDRNDDGKLIEDEMQRQGKGRHGGKGHGWFGGGNQ